MTMPQPLPIATSLNTLLPLLQTQLSESLSLDPTRILIVCRASRDVDHYGAEREIILRPRGLTPEQGIIDGAGRVITLFAQRLEMILRCRQGTDQGGSDRMKLTDATRGIIQMWENVVASCQLFTPTDEDGNALLWEPMRCLRIDDSERDNKQVDWVEVTIPWEMKYWFATVNIQTL
jgi:hypothetical protein